MTNDLFQQIARERETMVGAERRVADSMLRQPEQVVTMNLGDLAADARVSGPTVIRFCRRFACVGYQEFKLRLAQSLVPQAPFAYASIEPDDPMGAVVTKVITNSLHSIQRFAKDVDTAAIEQAVDRLVKAKNIFLFGQGISETVTFDAEHKFFRLGLHCRVVFDPQRQILLAPTLRPDEVALFFSHSGATKSLVIVASMARTNGGVTIAVTAPGSHLARACDLTIPVPAYEHTELYTPLTSRLNHMLVVNMLVAGIGIRQGRPRPDNLAALDPWDTGKFVS